MQCGVVCGVRWFGVGVVLCCGVVWCCMANEVLKWEVVVIVIIIIMTSIILITIITERL